MRIQAATPTLHGRTPIVVYGATGHTGQFVCGELQRRGLTFALAGRNTEKLQLLAAQFGVLDVRTASVDDGRSLVRALEGAHAVINCAGPFLDTAAPLVEAAMEAGVHYLDVTAEQASAQATLQTFSKTAEERGLIVLPAAAFYGGLADLLATAAAGDWPSVDLVEVAIALDSWHPTSGTRTTGKRNTAARLMIAHGELVPVVQPAPQRSWRFAGPFGDQAVVELPFTETIALSRHLQVTEAHTYLNLLPLAELRDPNTAAPVVDTSLGRSMQTFRVEVAAHRNGTTRLAAASGHDIYAVSAPIIVEAAARLQAPRAGRGGAFALGELFDARSFLGVLTPEHLLVELGEK